MTLETLSRPRDLDDAAELQRALAVDVQADRRRGGSRHRWPRPDLA